METKKPEVKARNFYGSGKYKYEIYPDHWKKSWGEEPMLGIIYADEEFYAIREAYSRGLLPYNYSIYPVAVCIGEATVLTPEQSKQRRDAKRRESQSQS